MMKTNFQKIADFHLKFDDGNVPLADLLTMRRNFLKEELREVEEAMDELLAAETGAGDKRVAKAHLLKELGDMLCVTYGTLWVLGADGDAVFDEVHTSNMSKTPGGSGKKAIKGPGYVPADTLKFVKESEHGTP